jgi:hypothetical protein
MTRSDMSGGMSYIALTLRLPVDSRPRPAFLNIATVNPKLNRSTMELSQVQANGRGCRLEVFYRITEDISNWPDAQRPYVPAPCVLLKACRNPAHCVP